MHPGRGVGIIKEWSTVAVDQEIRRSHPGKEGIHQNWSWRGMAHGISETVSWNRSFLSWVLKVEKEFARKIRKDRAI